MSEHVHDDGSTHAHEPLTPEMIRADKVVNRLRDELQAANEARIAAQVDLDIANERVSQLAEVNTALAGRIAELESATTEKAAVKKLIRSTAEIHGD